MAANADAIYRLPNPAEIDRSLTGTDVEKIVAMRKLKKAVERAWNTHTDEVKRSIESDFTGWGQTTTVVQFLASTEPAKGYYYDERRLLVNLIEAIRTRGRKDLTIHPGYAGPRELTAREADNLDAIVTRLKVVVTDIESVNQETRLKNVFGQTKVQDARNTFRAGIDTLEKFAAGKQVRIDMIKKKEVWHSPGSAGATQMTLSSGVLDEVDDSAVIVVAHEMTHIIPGGGATGDKMYSHQAGFKTAGEQLKLVTAAYYEEVVRQILKKEDTPPFIPVDGTSPHVITPTVLEQYKVLATKLVTDAWATVYNIYDKFREAGAFAEPRSKAGLSFRWPAEELAWMKNASRMLGLSIHRRSSLQADDKNPVTPLDMALVEHRIATLSKLMTRIPEVIALPMDVDTFREDKVDGVLRHALVLLNNNRATPGVLTNKNVDKDIDLIHCLAALNDAPGWAGLMPALKAGVPARMAGYGD